MGEVFDLVRRVLGLAGGFENHYWRADVMTGSEGGDLRLEIGQ